MVPARPWLPARPSRTFKTVPAHDHRVMSPLDPCPARPCPVATSQGRLPLQLAYAHLRPPWCGERHCASLRYRANRIRPEDPYLDALHIQGVPAQRLHALQVRDDDGLVFDMGSLTDTIGRSVSAGEIVQSLSLQTTPSRLTLHSETFLRRVLVGRAVVELDVNILDGQDIHAIAVHVDLAPA